MLAPSVRFSFGPLLLMLCSCLWQFALLPATESSLPIRAARSSHTAGLPSKEEVESVRVSGATAVPSSIDPVDSMDLSGQNDSASLLDLTALTSAPKPSPLIFSHDSASGMSWLRCPDVRRERGVVLLFHGCSHSSEDWFSLP